MKTNTNLTRRSFLAASSLGAMTLRTPSLLAQKKDVFETLLPKGCQRILAVRQDGSLLALVGTGEGSVSRDGGETWQTPFPFLQEGRAMTGTRVQLVTLNEGRLGMVYSEEVESRQGRGNRHRTLRFAGSEDGGKTWSGGVDIDLPGPLASTLGAFLQVPFGRLRQLSSGRLLLPVYWQFNGLHAETREAFARGIHQGKPIRLEGHGHRPQMSGCYAYFSDDEGASWERSEGSIMVWPLPGEHDLGGFGGTSEPVVQELRDSRILMLLRTKVGRFFQSISGDGGKSWQAATPTQLSSGDVPCDLDRLRSSRDLLVIWNQTSGQEIRAGYYRSRLSVALSSNEGRSWSNFKTVESSPGLPEAGQVSPPPVAHIRVNPNAGTLPDGFTMHHYPSLAFAQGQIFMTYQADSFRQGQRTRRIKLKRVPESWFRDGWLISGRPLSFCEVSANVPVPLPDSKHVNANWIGQEMSPP